MQLTFTATGLEVRNNDGELKGKIELTENGIEIKKPDGNLAHQLFFDGGFSTGSEGVSVTEIGKVLFEKDIQVNGSILTD